MEKRRVLRDFNSVAVLTAVVCLFSYAFSVAVPASAQSEVDRLKGEISTRNSRLDEIEREIREYQAELKKVGSEKNSLQKAISQLELERKKVQADIRYTENRIGATDLEIEKLEIEIEQTENDISLNRQAITETLQSLNEIDDLTLVEVLLEHENLSDFWNKVDELDQVRRVMANEVVSLISQKVLLDGKYAENTEKRQSLLSLKNQYSDQNTVLVNNTAEKSKLLTATKNQETEYQKLLREKEAVRAQLEKELRDFESQLQFILDPSSIPKKGTQVFAWPVESVVITQLFGGTEFAKQNPGIYGRAYHPGVDFGVPRGTKVYAPLSGTVRATGDTDKVAGCYSWGKWILIDHANGLSTLYAHLSVISVSPGQSVKTGDVIAYSGNTGYSTGPHLHFTVYAKAGVSVKKFSEFKTTTSCGSATTPVAATDAYIDPMVYLPKR